MGVIFLQFSLWNNFPAILSTSILDEVERKLVLLDMSIMLLWNIGFVCFQV